jgi:hypothetical protein
VPNGWLLVALKNHVDVAIPAISLTHPAPSNKLKTLHIEPNLWQTAFTSSFLTGP